VPLDCNRKKRIVVIKFFCKTGLYRLLILNNKSMNNKKDNTFILTFFNIKENDILFSKKMILLIYFPFILKNVHHSCIHCSITYIL